MSFLTGEKIYLRALREKDATQRYCDWLNDSIVNQYLSTRSATIPELESYIRSKNESAGCVFLGIFTKDHEHIGNTKLEPITSAKAVFSILIGSKDHWGGGIGTEVTQIMVEYAFDVLKVNTVELGVKQDNAGAIKVYKKIGFQVSESHENGITMEIKR